MQATWFEQSTEILLKLIQNQNTKIEKYYSNKNASNYDMQERIFFTGEV